jgi:adenylate kinase
MQQAENIALISIHPRHAGKILSGEKCLEFRRSWTSRPVSKIVIYATVPVQKIVGVATVKKVHKGSPTALWRLAKERNGGLLRRELYDYFRGKKRGFAIELGSVKRIPVPLDPEALFGKFTPPQSFAYLDKKSFARIAKGMDKQKEFGQVIFVAGVHGVGKTTLCDDYFESYGVQCRSASQLIKEAKEDAVARGSKNVMDIAGNQELLINAVRKIAASGKTLLLDGHFALLNESSQIEMLSAKNFVDLGVAGVVLVTDKPSFILSRLKDRDGKGLDYSMVKALQIAEAKQARAVSQELGAPMFEINAFDNIGFRTAIQIMADKPVN